MSKKYTYDEVLFLVKEFEKDFSVNLDKKNKSIHKFQGKYGSDHSYDSLKMLCDNILSSMGVEGYTLFSKGSLMVQEVVAKRMGLNNQ